MDKQINTRLAREGVRYTTGRKAVVAGLAKGGGPMTVAEIQSSLETTVPLSSLYRTLQVMSDAGVVSPHHSSSGSTRYELAEWLLGHHHHLVCTKCGSVEDIEISRTQEDSLGRLVIALAGGSGFIATDHSLEIDGICRGCQS